LKAVRRLGKTPQERGDTTAATGSLDIVELDGGDFAVIGTGITDQIGINPLPDARCATDERIVKISRATLISAKIDIPER
jgi:hypothetical protein